MNLEALIRDQNPYWLQANYLPSEASWYHRPHYQEIIDWLGKGLIISLTGLRRVGKSTLIKQVLSYLLTKKPTHSPLNIFYFSFDGSIVKNESETLRQILNTFATFIHQKPLSEIDKKTFIFLDEVQIIPYWQDIIKTYYDMNSNLQFIISGSASLFISKKSTESLAGRLKEIIVPPLSFTEYLTLSPAAFRETGKLDLEKYSRFYPEYLTAFFEKYLEIGQFPQPVKDSYSENDTYQYLQTIEGKIIEIDLPRTFPIKRPDILKIIFTYIKQSSGSLLSYENLTNDLGVDIRTTVRYIDWLIKAFLVNICLNQTKKMVKSGRTIKKIYLTSTNFAQNLSIGGKVETYIFNFLKTFFPQVEFFRFQNHEVDFVTTTKAGQKIPWEVKYQQSIRESEMKNLKNFAARNNSPYAFLLTKNIDAKTQALKPEKIGKTLLYRIPTSQVELCRETLLERIF